MAAARQSFAWWCFANRGIDPGPLLAGAAEIGYAAVDLLDEPLWPIARDHGLSIAAICGHASIEHGLNRREDGHRIEQELCVAIEKAHRWNIPILICFAGNRDGVTDTDGLEHCAETLDRVAVTASEAGVTLAIELLNSKVDHPGYQCDHTAWGVELCRHVHSPSVRLLYDVYHMQIMEGDIIRTIREQHPFIAHYHTAGNPGRCQPDGAQELCYPAIYRAIAATGYAGYIAHEFIPSLPPLDALARAYADCDQALGEA
jgi:hydroxypyruvate isomerase